MSFYFPVITSSIELEESKQVVNTKLHDMYESLEWLIHWENQYNQESIFDNPPSNYVYLKNVIDTIIKGE